MKTETTENIKGCIVKIIDNNLVIIDKGFENGVRPGMQFAIYSYTEDLIHPKTKKELGKFEIIKGRLIIKTVKPQLALGEVIYNLSNYSIDIPQHMIDSDPLFISIGDDIKTIPKPEINAKLNKSEFSPGDVITTTATFKGFLINGFFDNAIKYPKADGKGVYWNPDPASYNNLEKTGYLQEYIEFESTWDFVIPADAPEGEFLVSVRMYEDPYGFPNKDRRLVAKKEISISVKKKE